MSKKLTKQTSVLSMIFGLHIVLFIFLLLIITSLLLIAGIDVNVFILPIALLLSSVSLYMTIKKYTSASSLKGIFMAIGLITLVMFSIGLASQTLDSSWDSNGYHKEAVGLLRDGWNPVYQSVSEFKNNDKSVIDRATYNDIWIESYAKASWFVGSSVYVLTGNVESGKIINILSMIALFFCTYALFSRRFNRHLSILFATLISANPIIIGQIFTYYNDGLLASITLLLMTLLSILIFFKKDEVLPNRMIVVSIVMILVIAINVKFTGLIFSGIICLVYFAYVLLKPIKNADLIRVLTAVGVTSLFIGVMFVGLSTYPKNFINYGNFMYPLMGENKVDIISYNEPAGFDKKNWLKKMIVANFSETSNSHLSSSDEKPKLKIPFYINFDKLSSFSNVDQRIAGYGVWFGGVLVAMFLMAIFILVKDFRIILKNKKNITPYLIAGLSIAVIGLSNDNEWWARYYPHLYAVPILFIILLYSLKYKFLPNAMVFLLIFNTSLVGLSTIYNQNEYQLKTNTATDTHINCDKNEYIYTEQMFGFVYNLHDKCGHVDIISPSERKHILENGGQEYKLRTLITVLKDKSG